MSINRLTYSLSIAITTVIFVFMLKTDLGNALGIGAPFLLYLSAVMLSAWYGGIIAGILSTFFSGLICLFFYLPPYNSFAVNRTDTLLQLFIYIFEGLTISFFINSYANIKENHRRDKLSKQYDTNIIKKFQSIFSNKASFYILGIFLLTYYIFTIRIFIRQIPDMSFVDSFNNYMGAYFMLKGKKLYSEIFFNHQMLMAYLSYVIQLLTHPNTLTKLVIYHRLFIQLLATMFDILLIWRFRLTGLCFVLFYELCDFYLFGNFFLGEAIIVYPSVYLLGLAWEKLQKQLQSRLDFILSAVAVWAIIFLRETFIPLAIFLYILFLWNKKITKFHVISIITFFVLSGVTLSTVPLKYYLFDLINVNIINNISHEIVKNQLFGAGVLSIFFYPIALFFGGVWNFFRFGLLGLDIIFLTLIVILISKLNKKRAGVMIFFVLGFASIRFASPGEIFYGAFHLLPWLGLFIFSVFLMLTEVYKNKMMRTINILIFAIICVFSFLILSFRWFVLSGETFPETFDRNYGRYYSHGKAIQVLALHDSKLFVDGWDSLTYWVADIPSSYAYTFYYPVMKNIPEFENARITMFLYNSPDFYYTDCENNPIALPQFAKKQYTQLLHNHTPGCLFVKKRIIDNIDSKKLEKLKRLGFELPIKLPKPNSPEKLK